jgi:hypothetical protein
MGAIIVVLVIVKILQLLLLHKNPMFQVNLISF